ncbi:UTP--glucose-1-phosphate uridylyltransferase [Devriesea agamarum]|uniref:UTP--glucose-1-phosphate uridylyltransferase n=1 Tax=Devriesea agamarum TaxID=472569 RepID=UPI00071C5F50|nr:UTP--glucose-1-phosphate uridylyltransferase [Devriesea agamarum]
MSQDPSVAQDSLPSTPLAKAQHKMREAGVADRAIDVFTHYYGLLKEGTTGQIPEETIRPYVDPPQLADVQVDEETQREAFAKLAVINLNGGLGTSMGMDRAKSLLPVRGGLTFLDVIVEQVRAARQKTGARLPLVFMNSFRTEADTWNVLARYPDLQVGDLPLSFVQNKEPKLTVDTLEPVSWPADPELEWCPPGHGDIYTALETSGLLDALLEAGFEYASISNSDNLGTVPSPKIAGWFAASGAPYAAELCRRTAADRKGGHLAIRVSDGRLILRDTAQTPAHQMDFFTDEHRHPFFHTNNLWFNLPVLKKTLEERRGVLGLPMIRNEKTVDPADKTSPKVYQIETAMGAAIEVFEGATAIVVDRARFLPVKATSDLLLVRSDIYELDDDFALVRRTEHLPLVSLDQDFYKLIGDFEARFPAGVPSMREATRFEVTGDHVFDSPVVVHGSALIGPDDPAHISAGTTVGTSDSPQDS